MLSISPTHKFFWNLSKDGSSIIPNYNYKKRPRRQDLKIEDVSYIENGSLYIFTYNHFIKKHNRLGGKVGYTIFPEEYSGEIDTNLDFIAMQEISKHLKLIDKIK